LAALAVAHPSAPGLGHLNGEVADATTGAADQHVLASIQMGGVNQPLPGGMVRDDPRPPHPAAQCSQIELTGCR
jgi:hypothetical protein